MKLKIKGDLFHCGRCRKSYSNPFGHTCVTRLDRKAPDGKTKLAPKLGLSAGTCGKCHKPVGNPITHTCTVRSDFKKRTAKAKKDAAAAKRKAARKGQPEHPQPRACKDEDCKRATCAAYKDGYEDGYGAGYAAGYDSGHADGMAEGEAAGYAAGAAAGQAAS